MQEVDKALSSLSRSCHDSTNQTQTDRRQTKTKTNKLNKKTKTQFSSSSTLESVQSVVWRNKENCFPEFLLFNKFNIQEAASGVVCRSQAGCVKACVCVCVSLHLLHWCSFFFGWRLQVNGSNTSWFLHTGQETKTHTEREREDRKRQWHVCCGYVWGEGPVVMVTGIKVVIRRCFFFFCILQRIPSISMSGCLWTPHTLKVWLYSRVWRDGRGHHQHVVPLPEEPPQAVVVSSHVQVPNMEALSRRHTDSCDYRRRLLSHFLPCDLVTFDLPVPWRALSRWTCPSPSPSWWTWRRSSPQSLEGTSPRTGSYCGPAPPPPWSHTAAMFVVFYFVFFKWPLTWSLVVFHFIFIDI